MEKGYQKIRREDLVKTMKGLRGIFDLVRIVEPDSASVITATDDKEFRCPHEPCYFVWGKQTKCENCISKRACIEKRRLTKLEYIDDDIFHVIAIPYLVEDKHGEQMVTLELVSKITDEVIVVPKEKE